MYVSPETTEFPPCLTLISWAGVAAPNAILTSSTPIFPDVCQRCHLQGTSVLAEGKSFESFKPGMKLEDVMDTYLPKFEDDHSFIMASHVDRLKQSSCFQNTSKR